MLRKIFILTISSFLATSLFAQDLTDSSKLFPPTRQLNNPSKTKIWENANYHIQLQVPSDWKKIEPNEGEIVSFATPHKNIFAVRGYKGLFPGNSEYTRKWVEIGLIRQDKTLKLISSRIDTIKNVEFIDLIFDKVNGERTDLYRAIIFHNGLNSFFITCLYSKSHKVEFDKAIRLILSSIQFAKNAVNKRFGNRLADGMLSAKYYNLYIKL